MSEQSVQAEEAEASAPHKSLEERTADVRSCLTANHGNTLALLACLRACRGEARPYRGVEEELAGKAAFDLSTQTPHVLVGLLVKAGGIERIDVPEESAKAPVADETAAASDEATEEPIESPEQPQTAVSDQPVDYLLRTTDAGEAVLAEFDVQARFERLVAAEPDGYLDVYLAVLNAAAQTDGAKLPQIEAAVKGMPALMAPKRVYASYFVSKLETVGAIAWDGVWRLTADGDAMLSNL